MEDKEEEELIEGDKMAKEGAVEEGKADWGTARVFDEATAMTKAKEVEEMVAIVEASQEVAALTKVLEESTIVP